MYNWQQDDWRQFRYEASSFLEKAMSFMAIAGQSFGYLQGLSSDEQAESIVSILVKEAIKTSSIEGEFISRIDVISSIRKNLGYTTPSFQIRDKRSAGIADLLVKAREDFDSDLTEEMLFEWHRSLFLGNTAINVGQYRSHSEPMQVVSGAIVGRKYTLKLPPQHKSPMKCKHFWHGLMLQNQEVNHQLTIC